MANTLKIDLGLPPLLNTMAKTLLGLGRLEAIHKNVQPDSHEADKLNSPGHFCRKVLVELGASFEFPSQQVLQLKELHKSGTPLIFVANHPLGALEALILVAILDEVSPDFKVIANAILATIPELKNCLLTVNILGKKPDPRKNLQAMRQAVEHLRGGGVLGMFPAGQVSSFETWRSKQVSDIEWSAHLGRIVMASGATVVPLFFEGRNSLLFQYVSLTVPELRVALLAREMLGHRKPVQFQMGAPIEFATLAHLGKPEVITRYLRTSCENLASIKSEAKHLAKIGRAKSLKTLTREIDRLRSLNKCLVKKDSFEAFIFARREAPHLVEELGRLRELTFREVGEGTGKARDLDRFDEDYLHLALWDQSKSALVGSYRLGLVDRILKAHGADGLYTSTLFSWDVEFLKKHPNSIELGRSFVSLDYQKNFWALHMLWQALGQFIHNNPKYRYLFGPVSISGKLHTTTQAILVKFLSDNHAPSGIQSRPVVEAKRKLELPPASQQPKSIRDAQRMIQESVDPSFRVPPLLKHYSALGGEVLGFNVDAEFQDSIDCLFFVDLHKADPDTVGRYIPGFGVRPSESTSVAPF